jgi:hypothetical protein
MDSNASKMSSPTHHEVRSFLDLPAELRNWIYKVYLKQSQTLSLADTGNGKVTLCQCPGDDSDYVWKDHR